MVNKILLVGKWKREEGLPKERQRPSSMCSFPVSMSQNLHNHLVESFIVLMTDTRGRPSTHAPSGYRSQVETHIQASGSTSGHEGILSHPAKRALLGGTAFILPPGE